MASSHRSPRPRFAIDASSPAEVTVSAEWRLDPWEAIVVGVLPPPCDGWVFDVMDRTGGVVGTLSSDSARLEPDGRLVMVLTNGEASEGAANWIGLGGETAGRASVRWLRPSAGRPIPAAEVVEIADLARHLPPAPEAPAVAWWRRVVGG